MTIINCRLFGFPIISENQEDIFIPQGKVSALFYYILLKKVISRDEAAGIFWPDSNEEKAKISLRNALHKIRRAFSCDVIVTPNRSTLTLNEGINFVIDVEEFDKEPLQNLSLYKGEFLKGFYLKDAIEFERFVIDKRAYYKEFFISSALKKVEADIENNNTERIEGNLLNLIAVDNYNEKAYYLLMKFYLNSERYDKVINEYHTIQKIYMDELGIEPSQEIDKIYKEAIQKVSGSKSKKAKSVPLFYSRNYEMEVLQKNIDDFYNGQTSGTVLIRGEIGIGKSLLKGKIIENNKDKFNIFETNCYSVEKKFSFSPWMKVISAINNELNERHSKKPIFWNDVISKLFPQHQKNNIPVSKILERKEHFDSGIIFNVLSNALEQLSVERKTIIAIEDIHFADEESLSLLIDLSIQLNNNVMFLLTASNDKNEKVDSMIISLKEMDKIMVLDLEPFSKEDVAQIIKKSLGENSLNEKEMNDIYEKSNGNALFLNEYISLYKNNQKDQLLTKKLNEILDIKFSGRSDSEKDVLSIIALFYKEVNLDHILKLVPMNSLDMVKILNTLENANILEEKRYQNEIFLKFTHSVYKDYIYNALNPLSRKVLHREVASMLESELISNKDITTYIKIKYHYNMAEDVLKTLKYEVHILNYYLNYSHELFPDLDDHDLTNQERRYINNNKAIELLNDLETSLLKLKNSIKSKSEKLEIDNVELMYIYSKGRYLIRQGNYKDGIIMMENVIRLASDLEDQRMILAGYKQMVIYGIQINEPQIMLRYIVKAMKVSKQLNDNNELGVFNRLYGLYYLMEGNETRAETFFNKSISLLTNSGRVENINSISVAAAYNYIGEIRKSKGLYDDAMDYFQKSIDLCKNGEVSCLAIFYINSGKTSFLRKNLREAKDYFLRAKDIVEQFDSYWNRSVLEGFLALVFFYDEKYDKSLAALENTMDEDKTINNPRHKGLIYFVYTILSFEMEDVSKINYKGIDDFLAEASSVYFNKAMQYLDQYRDKAEIEYLKNYKNVSVN